MNLKFKCPLCGCKSFTKIPINSVVPIDDSAEHFSYIEADLFECSDCSLAFSDPKKISKVNIKRRFKDIDMKEAQEFWANYDKNR